MENLKKHEWTDAARDTIKTAFLSENLSYGKIAAIYSGKLDGGRKLTLNMVAGILSRAGVKSEMSGRLNRTKSMPPRSSKPVIKRLARLTPKNAAKAAERSTAQRQPSGIKSDSSVAKKMKAPAIKAQNLRPSPTIDDVPDSLRLSLDVLANNQCRYETHISPDGRSLFCGHGCRRLAVPRSGRIFESFCPAHQRSCEDPRSAAKIQKNNRTIKYILRCAA